MREGNKTMKNNVKYIKSEYTGQVYRVAEDFQVQYGGWLASNEAEYVAWCNKVGIEI